MEHPFFREQHETAMADQNDGDILDESMGSMADDDMNGEIGDSMDDSVGDGIADDTDTNFGRSLLQAVNDASDGHDDGDEYGDDDFDDDGDEYGDDDFDDDGDDDMKLDVNDDMMEEDMGLAIEGELTSTSLPSISGSQKIAASASTSQAPVVPPVTLSQSPSGPTIASLSQSNVSVSLPTINVEVALAPQTSPQQHA